MITRFNPRSLRLEHLEQRQLLSVAPHNVILLIGDGMGPEQVEAGRYSNNGPLSFETFPYQGELTTYSANNAVTDSAAAATALATGQKVNDGVISMAVPGDGAELKTSLEAYQDLGKATGLITTTHMTHATPAAFGAHEPARGNYAQIASDYLNQTQPNILFGGNSYMSGAAGAGYTVTQTRADMQTLGSSLDNTVTDASSQVYVSGQFGSGHMPYEFDGLGNLPHLSEMTATALSVLDNDPDGLFLMVEAGRIDHIGHATNINRDDYIGPEVVEFSKAVQTVVDWVDDATNGSDWTNTLVIVTADHETGGLDFDFATGTLIDWASTGHTAANVPIYARGLNAKSVGGTMDNTDVFSLTTEAPTNAPFSVVMIPDTQKYVQDALPQFADQTQWIVDQAVMENLAFVTHVGDLVQNDDDAGSSQTIGEWTRAVAAMDTLDTIPIPYSAVPGNHDYNISISGGVNSHSGATDFTDNFGASRYAESWYGGASSDDLNHYQIFNAGGRDYLHLGLEFEPRASAITWAQGVLDSHPDLPVILTTHGYLGTSGRLTTSRTTDGFNGEAIFQTLVSPNPQIFMVLSGHESGEYHQVSTNDYGQDVIEILADYQDRNNGTESNYTNGFMRLIDFIPDLNRINVRTYSPTLDLYERDADSQFSLNLDFDQRFDFTNLPQVTTFQQGVGGYSSMVDTMIRGATPTTNYAIQFEPGKDFLYNADASSDGSPSHVLLRFDDMVGAGSGQIEPGSTIVSATLKIRSTDGGDGGSLHQMLMSWVDTDVTWDNSFGENGIQADNSEAASSADDYITANTTDTDVDFDVTAALQAWANGTATNNGWAILPGGSGGWHMAAAEHPTVGWRPELIVSFVPGDPNDPPVANDDSGTTDEDTALTIAVLGNDDDLDSGDTLSVSLVTDGTNGTVVNNGTDVTYTPNADFNGTDSFTYTVNDGRGGTDTATVNVTVTPINDIPVANAQGVTTEEDTTIAITLTGVDGDPEVVQALTFTLSGTGPTYGSLGVVNPSTGEVTYIPNTGYSGTDTFTFTVTDDAAAGGPALTSTEATVSVTVTPAAQKFYATGETTMFGTVVGSRSFTEVSDGIYETLTEIVQRKKSLLEHTWTFDLTGGDTIEFSVEAHHNDGTEDDHFTFQYSTDEAIWINMVTVTKTGDDDTAQTYLLPPGTTGTVYVRAIDTNRAGKKTYLDTLYVDQMFISTVGGGVQLPTVSVEATDDSAAEAGLDPGTFTISRTDTSGDLIVGYSVSGSASEGTDYEALSSMSVTLLDGVSSVDIPITPMPDTEVEGSETVILTIDANAAYNVGSPGSDTVTILDNDGPTTESSLAISDVSQKEGNSGTKTFTFTVTRTGDTSGTVTVDFATADDTAQDQLSDGDYFSASDSLTFAPNVTTQTIPVTVFGDTVYEPHETFFVNLSNATGGATISDYQGIGTIRNDDRRPKGGGAAAAESLNLAAVDALLSEGESSDDEKTDDPSVIDVALLDLLEG